MIEFESFLHYYKEVKKVSADTLRDYRSDLKFFGQLLSDEGVTRLTQVDHALITKFIERMEASPVGRSDRAGLSEATIARRLAAVSSFLDFVRVTKLPKLRNPVVDYKRRWKRNNRSKPVAEDVLEKLLTAIIVPRDRVLVQLFLASGLRLSEMAQLDRDSIKAERNNTDGSYLGVGEVLGKGGKRRTFYVHPKILVPLFRYLKDRKDECSAMFVSERKQRMSNRAMQERMGYWCREAGVPHVRLHRLRHTYATRLINADMDVLQLKELMGHNSLATTLQYAEIADTTLARGYHAAMEFVDL